MTISAKITSKGQITLPAEMRKELGLKPGDSIDFRRNPEGGYEVVAKTHALAELRGIVKLDKPVSSQDIENWIKQARQERALKVTP